MPLYAYRCNTCLDEWEAWHTVDERTIESHCGVSAAMPPTIFSGRPNGITKEKPKLEKKQKAASQLYDKDGNKTIDNTIINKTIDRINKKKTKINATRGYKDD